MLRERRQRGALQLNAEGNTDWGGVGWLVVAFFYVLVLGLSSGLHHGNVPRVGIG